MFRDVRMRGFQRRAPVDEVVEWVDALPAAPRTTEVTLAEAVGRVLAADVVSTVDVPAFPRAAMDGWAVRAEETFGAAETDPVLLRVVGTSLPGRPHAGTVARGQAVRIMTGAPVPAGADAVLRAEDGRQLEGELQVRGAVPPQKHVGSVGEDIAAGRTVLSAGRVLRPQDIGLASSIGRPALPVVAAPQVQLIATGDELLPAGATPDGVNIVDSNSPMLRALIERDGGVLARAAILPDDEPTVRRAFQEAEGDLVIVTGGSSVGEEDHAPHLLSELGELTYHGIAMRPAAPTGMGTIDGTPFFLLPGNPVSCLSAYDFFASRLVRRAAGLEPAWPYACVSRTLRRKISSVLGRLDYVRVRVSGASVEPVMARGASILSSVTEADGFVLVPQDHEGWAAGTDVDVHLY